MTNQATVDALEPEAPPAPSAAVPPIPELASLPRLLASVGNPPGPTLLCIAGLHGNEPAGIQAMYRVLQQLSDRAESLCGRFLCVVGNRRALARGCRFLREDLNRIWLPSRLERVRGPDPVTDEDVELRELDALVSEVLRDARRGLYALDVHTTSGPGAGFLILDDTLPNRAFARELVMPLVLGIEEEVVGTLAAYLHSCGAVTVGLEAGQHGEAIAVDRAAAALWIALEASGVLPPGEPEVDLARRLLRRHGRRLPAVVEVRYRHPVQPDDGFRMLPGFVSFQAIRKAETVAADHRGAVRTPASGRLLMPLYQHQGTDGFFVVRDVRRLWLLVSAGLRRLRLHRILHWLPGVQRHPDLPETFVVNRRLARFFALELLHLLGFRRHGSLADELLVSRRAHDR